MLTVNTLLDTSGGRAISNLRDAIAVVDAEGTNTVLSAAEMPQVAGTVGQNDTIVFAAGLSGTITLTASLPAVTRNVQILGPGPDQVTIDGGGDIEGGGQYQILSVSFVQVTIAGLTLANGRANGTNGGAIDGTSSNITVNNCAFTGNQASVAGSNVGGAISSTGNLTVTNSTFDGNYAYDRGRFINSSFWRQL